jgi:hypothetical protein
MKKASFMNQLLVTSRGAPYSAAKTDFYELPVLDEVKQNRLFSKVMPSCPLMFSTLVLSQNLPAANSRQSNVLRKSTDSVCV